MRFSGGFNGFLAQCGAADDAACYLGICVLLPATLTEHLPGNLLPLSLDVGPRQRNPEHLGYVSHGEVVGDQVDFAPSFERSRARARSDTSVFDRALESPVLAAIAFTRWSDSTDGSVTCTRVCSREEPTLWCLTSSSTK